MATRAEYRETIKKLEMQLKDRSPKPRKPRTETSARERYMEKLRDPRWQRKRLEVFTRADFACEECGAKDKTLHVHHGYYAKGLEPREYDSRTLWCLCWECDEYAEQARANLYCEIACLRPCCISPNAVFVLFSQEDREAAARRGDQLHAPDGPLFAGKPS